MPLNRGGAGALKLEEIPQAPVKTARCTVEKLAMLASSRRNRLGDTGWATLTGLIASTPATIHDLAEAYWQENPIGLSGARLFDVIVSGIFFGLFLMSLLERGDSAKKLLHEILYPNGPPYRQPPIWKFWD